MKTPAIMRFFLPLWLGAITASMCATPDAHELMSEGIEAFEQERYGAAATLFRQAADNAGEDYDAAAAEYNRGLALYKLQRYEEAAEAFRQAQRTNRLDVQQRARYNLGNALAAQGRAESESGRLPAAIERLEEALNSYRQSIILDPDDEDPKVNWQITRQQLEQLRELQEQMEQPEPDGMPPPDPEDGTDKEPEDDPPPEPRPEEQPNKAPGEPQPEAADPERQPEAEDAQPEPSERMTPEEAEMLLDASRQEELARRRRMRLKLGEPEPVEKNW